MASPRYTDLQASPEHSISQKIVQWLQASSQSNEVIEDSFRSDFAIQFLKDIHIHISNVIDSTNESTAENSSQQTPIVSLSNVKQPSKPKPRQSPPKNNGNSQPHTPVTTPKKELTYEEEYPALSPATPTNTAPPQQHQPHRRRINPINESPAITPALPPQKRRITPTLEPAEKKSVDTVFTKPVQV